MIVEQKRMARAVHLRVVRLALGRWKVLGGARNHVVVRTAHGAKCDCPDVAHTRGVMCKHKLAVLLSRLPEEVRHGLQQLVVKPRGAR